MKQQMLVSLNEGWWEQKVIEMKQIVNFIHLSKHTKTNLYI